MAAQKNSPGMRSRYLRWRGDEENCLQQLNEITGCLDAMLINVDAADFYSILGDSANVCCCSVSGDDPEDCLKAMQEGMEDVLPPGRFISEVIYLFSCETLEEANTFTCGMEGYLSSNCNVIFGAGWRDGGPFTAHMILPGSTVAVRMDEPLVLGRGTVLHSTANRYVIDRAFDAGGSSICYIAHNRRGERVLIKETYPLQLSRSLTRDAEDNLTAVAKNAKLRQAMAALLGEAVERTLRERELESDLQNKNLEFFEKNVDVFEANNTVYTVYNDFGKGTLAQMRGKVPLKKALILTDRLLQLLETLHKAGYLHLDISPENILLNTVVDDVESLRFIDLGSLIRQDQIEKQEVFPCKDGYSPTELFGAATSQEALRMIGERTDTFSVGAVLYNLLTGRVTDWETCRRGNTKIIKPEDPGIQLSDSWRVEVGEMNISSKLCVGVSPRVLRILNDFLSTALCNNPKKRFQTAGEMRQALRGVLRSTEKYEHYFEYAEMPEDFMEDAIDKENALLSEADRGLLLSAMVKRIRQKPMADPKIMRRRLQEGKTLLLDRYCLQSARIAVEKYVAEFGDQYDEILFVDESEGDCRLFSGELAGTHKSPCNLYGDERTLLIFYGRTKELENGIVEMANGLGEASDSLAFMRETGSVPPHVIRILPARMVHRISKASVSSMVTLAMAPVFFVCFTLYKLMTSYYVQNRLLNFLDPARDPNGGGWLYLQIREVLSRCQPFGYVRGYLLEENNWAYKLDGELSLLRGFQELGLAPMAGIFLLTGILLVWAWKRARDNRLSAAAWMLFTSRWLASWAYNLSLLPVAPGDVWTTPKAILVNWILLFFMLVWPRMKGSRETRDGGWGLLRMGSGIFGHWVFRAVWPYLRFIFFWVPSGLVTSPNSLTYLFLSLLVIIASDAGLELLAARSMSMRRNTFWEDAGELWEMLQEAEKEEPAFTRDLTEEEGTSPAKRLTGRLKAFLFEDEEEDEDDFTQV